MLVEGRARDLHGELRDLDRGERAPRLMQPPRVRVPLRVARRVIREGEPCRGGIRGRTGWRPGVGGTDWSRGPGRKVAAFISSATRRAFFSVVFDDGSTRIAASGTPRATASRFMSSAAVSVRAPCRRTAQRSRQQGGAALHIEDVPDARENDTGDSDAATKPARDRRIG